MAVSLPPTDLVTPPVRLAFPSLFVPRRIPGAQRETYQAVALIPPDTDMSLFHNALRAAMTDKWGKAVKLPPNKNPIKDAAEKGDYEGYEEGWHFINCSTGYPPGVFDERKKSILDLAVLLGKSDAEQKQAIAIAETRVYGGCWVRIHMNAYGWDHPTGGRGLSFGLKAVQLVRTDEAFAGTRASADVFDAIGDATDEREGEDAEDLFG